MRFFFYLLLSLLPLPLFAGTITAELNPESGAVGDQFELNVTVEGSLKGDLHLPELIGLDILGRSSSTSMSWINGSFSKTIIYNFTLAAQREGNYQIPSISAQVDGETLKTPILNLKVHKATSGMGGWTPPSKSHKNAVTPPRGRDEDREDPETQKEDATYPPVFLERTFSKTEVYEGEPITSEVKLYHRVGVLKAEAIPQGNSLDLRTFDLDQVKKEEVLGPYRYNVIVVRQTLVPLKAGVVRVPPYRVDLKILLPEARARAPRSPTEMDEFFEDFFGRVRGGRPVSKALVSNPAELKVKPVPEAGQPPNYKGVVGRFEVKADITARTLKAGETSTLTLTIEGSGLLDPLGKVELALGQGVKVYGDKPAVKQEVTAARGVYSQRVYKFALVPSHGGEIHLGKFQLPYFDPHDHRFKVATADLGKLHVEGSLARAQVVTGGPTPELEPAAKAGGHGEGAQSLQTAVQLKAFDLHDLHREPYPNSVVEALAKQQHLWLRILQVIRWILGVVFVLWVTYLVKNTLWKDTPLDMRRFFRRKAFQIYQSKRKKITPARSRSFRGLVQVYQLFREYLGNLWGLNGEAITSRDIADAMERHKVPEELRARVLELCVMMDRMSFSREEQKAKTDEYRSWCEDFDQCAKELKSYGL